MEDLLEFSNVILALAIPLAVALAIVGRCQGRGRRPKKVQ